MFTTCEEAITKKTILPATVISSLGFAMPFQPSMWDDKSINAVLVYITNIIETKLKGKYSDKCTEDMLARIKELFSRLNFNTHRKSLVVLLCPVSEKIFYLNFPVRLFVSVNSYVSILDLVSGIKRETDFYLSVIDEEKITCYEHFNRHLNKVYEQKADQVSAGLNKESSKASAVIAFMNSQYQQPVFITGDRQQVQAFQRVAPFPEIIYEIIRPAGQYGPETMQSIVTGITDKWSYWLSKFIVGRVVLAQKNNTLIFHYEAVLRALRKSTDGLLLLDRRLKKQLQKPKTGNTGFQNADELFYQIERFVHRGNRLEITEPFLLNDWGGIVLIPVTMPACQGKLSLGMYYNTGWQAISFRRMIKCHY